MNSNANARYTLNNAKHENMATGKYCRRDNQFKSKRYYFDLDTCEAYSYNWWQFVIKIGNTIYFNDPSYSMQTHLHQTMAKNVLLWEGVGTNYEHKNPLFKGIKIVYVYYREGLNHLDNAISNMYYEIRCIKEAMANPRSLKRKNKERVKEIARLEKRIKRTRKFMVRVNRQKTVNEKILSQKRDRIFKAEMKRDELKRMRWQKEYLKQRELEKQQPILTLVSSN